MLGNYSKRNMLKYLESNMTKIRLKYQDGSTSSIVNEPNLWVATSYLDNTLVQDDLVEFNIDTSSGTVNISGYQLLFNADDEVAFDINFEQIYSYPNNGTFTFDGLTIEIN